MAITIVQLEDILLAIKPLLKKYNLQLLLSDEIVVVGDRYYVKSTATISDDGRQQRISIRLCKRSSSTKNMSDPQQTACSSSFARRVLPSALALLDESEADPDSDYQAPTHSNDTDRSDRRINAREITKLKTAILQSGKTVAQALKAAKCDCIEEMTLTQYNWILKQCA